ncbi:MAG: hypothetical protein JWP25_5675, partial [Bradyrhizobium sp.]|nr:hypothetical protein [Bradyrhizobium sp.]
MLQHDPCATTAHLELIAVYNLSDG